MQRMGSWVRVFAGYRHVVNEQRIDRWLQQFEPADRDMAARILDSVEFVSYEQLASAFRSVLNSQESWSVDPGQRVGKWRFVAFSSSSGESGDTMLHRFRLANSLNGKKYNDLFIHKSELVRADLSPQDTVVFVDDFCATGQQVTDSWNENIAELIPGQPRALLIVYAASLAAKKKVNDETPLTLISYIDLDESDNVFSPSCTHFNKQEKERLLHYCARADRRNPKGRGDCGLLTVFAHNCPNNSIPIIHAHNARWEGLFRRYD